MSTFPIEHFSTQRTEYMSPDSMPVYRDLHRKILYSCPPNLMHFFFNTVMGRSSKEKVLKFTPSVIDNAAKFPEGHWKDSGGPPRGHEAC